MKKRIIIIAALLAALLLMTFRYSVIEQEDTLPDEVRYGLRKFFGAALAEAESPAPEETAVPTPSPEPTPVPTPEPLLERGDSGEEVKALQQRLRELGFMTGAADGKFGPKTEAAVIEFKKHLYALEQERIAAERAAAEAQAQLNAQTESAEATAEPTESAPAEDSAQTEPVPDESGDSAQQTGPIPAESAVPTETVPADPAQDAAEAIPAVPADPGAAIEPIPTDSIAADAAERDDGQSESAPADPAENAQTEGDPAESAENDSSAEQIPAEPVFEGKVDEETYRLLVEKGFDEYQGKLQIHSRGAEVKRMQTRLKTLGYLTGKADGIFGKQTGNAVKTFQQQNKLTSDGIAGEKTQRALYSASAKKYTPPVPKQPKGKPYLLKVSTKDQRVYAYSWSEKTGAYTNLARTMICSTGLASTPTPKGSHTAVGPVVRWGYFPKYDVWAQYLYRISGPYLFHSVLYDEADESTVKWGSVNKLGSPASHGCIRLKVEDAKWIYNNCPAGTTVTVY